MALQSKQEVPRVEIDSVETLRPFIHIVRPLKRHSQPGTDHPIRDKGHIMVQMPVQLHVFDDVPDFDRRLQPELFSLVKSLSAEGMSKIHIRYDGLSLGNRAKVEALGSQMGFYKHRYEGKPVLAFDAEKFRDYSKTRVKPGV